MNIEEMKLDDIQERRAEIVARRDAMKAELEAAEDAALDALKEEAQQLNDEERSLNDREAAIMKAAEERQNDLNEVLKNGKEVRSFEKENEMEIRDSKEYIEAYANYVRTGDDTECRALLTENVNGVIPVPTLVGEIVAERLKASKILQRVRKMYAAGNVKVGFEYGAPAATVHEEGGEAQEEEALLLGYVTLTPETLKKWVAISDEALDSMAGEAYLRYIYDEVARGIIKARENAVVAAILTAPQVATKTAPSVPKTGTAAGAITDFVNARALLSSAAEDLVIICTPAQYAQYRGYQMSANYAVDPFDGLEVLFNDTVTAPIIGDLYGVLENLPKGEEPQIKYDDLTRKKEDLVEVLGRIPVATGVVGDKWFAKVSA